MARRDGDPRVEIQMEDDDPPADQAVADNRDGDRGLPLGHAVAGNGNVMQIRMVQCGYCNFGKLCPTHFSRSVDRLLEGRNRGLRKNMDALAWGIVIGGEVSPAPKLKLKHKYPAEGRILSE